MNRQFVLLPRDGLKARSAEARRILTALPRASSIRPSVAARLDVADRPEIHVVDTVSEDGPKLVELDEASAARTNAADSPLRALPVAYYDRPDPRRVARASATPLAGTTFDLVFEDANTGAPVSDVEAVAFDNFAARTGAAGRSDAAGRVTLTLPGGSIDRLYAYPPGGYWGAFRQSLPIQPQLQIDLTPVDLNFVDAVRHYYGGSRFDRNCGVTVGVLDSGVGSHSDLNVIGGRNTVTGEPANLWDDPDGHGTHVAGLIGSDNAPPAGLRGVAPGVALRAYRVFGHNSPGASNYAILKSMIFAASDGCDIINLSLGGGPFDEIVEEAVRDAREQGMLVLVAAGNDDRAPVNYPAAYTDATAVSAMGREGTFPAGSLEEAEVLPPPYANDPLEFLAAFSNVGSQIGVTGLGVGVLSTLPNNGFGPLSGTSMAAPVVAGAAASLLSRDPNLFAMARDRARSDAIEKLLQVNCVTRGFGLQYEGFGLPDPATV